MNSYETCTKTITEWADDCYFNNTTNCLIKNDMKSIDQFRAINHNFEITEK